MKQYTDFTDDDLQLVLQRMDEKDAPPLSNELTERVMSRIEAPSNSPIRGRVISPHIGRYRGAIWAVAASVAAIVALTIALWPKSEGSIYQDTFASAEDACLILSNNTDNNTIAL